MSEDLKKVNTNEEKERENKGISFDDLENVAGGGAFSDIPRVPNKKIDDKVRDNI